MNWRKKKSATNYIQNEYYDDLGPNVLNKFQSSVKLVWDKALWLGIASHMTRLF